MKRDKESVRMMIEHLEAIHEAYKKDEDYTEANIIESTINDLKDYHNI